MTKVVAITGGIGSGKTTLTNHLKKIGYPAHESDVVVSDMYLKPKKIFIKFIKEKISSEAVKNNKINKNQIANIVFNNKKLKIKLEKFIHEKVQSSRDNFVKKNRKMRKKIIFVDIPLLFENKLEKKFNLVVCIISFKKNRTTRVLKNNKFSRKILNKIYRSQTSDNERRKRANIIINNNKSKKNFICSAEKALMDILK